MHDAGLFPSLSFLHSISYTHRAARDTRERRREDTMARQDPDPPRELDPLKGGLKHNPFAALRAKAEAAGVPLPEKSSGGAKEVGGANGAQTPNAKPAPAIELVRERVSVRQQRSGHGGKTVTIAEGPGLAGRDLATLAKELAKGLGVGARVDGETLVAQGDQRERLASWLAARGFAAVRVGN